MPETKERPAPIAASDDPVAGSRRSFWVSWLLVAVLTASLTAGSTYQALLRYHEFRSGWSWDLAYYNQWFWALTNGNGQITVRPLSRYAEEGPSVWKMNYMAPVRLAIAPIYRLFPDTRTLLVFQNVIFWWVVPAAYTLVLSESRSRWTAVRAAMLVPLTPLLWPLCSNDFRELQLAIPFVLWAVQGIRARSAPLSILGIAGMLACRQEFAVMAATFAFIPARDQEPLGATLRWRHLLLVAGVSWFLFGFLGYLRFVVGRNAPAFFVEQFLTQRASLPSVIATSSETLLALGAWGVLACFAPRTAVLAIPWIWGVCSGQWSMDTLSTESWHHVRYVLPMTAVVLAAGLVGYARVDVYLSRIRGGRAWAVALWAVAATVGAMGLDGIAHRMARIPVPIDAGEAGEVWGWISQVDPADGVLADASIAAPLSSRARLYGYIMKWNLPFPYPRLDHGIRWVFIRNDYPDLKMLLDQGFEVVHRGTTITIAHRSETSGK